MSSRAAVAAPAVQPRRVPRKPPPLSVPRGPRRVSGPARRETPDRRTGRSTAGDTSIVLGLIAALESLSRHRLLDRLIRGRTWIALVAFALIGIVTMQLGLLKLNGGIGRALEQDALLQRENAALSIENSELAAGSRVQSLAARLGMESVPSGALRFLAANPLLDASRAAAALSATVPSPARSSEESGAGQTAATQPTEASGAGQSTPASGESPAAAESQAGAAGEATTASGESRAASGESKAAESKPAAGESTTASGESTAAAGTPTAGSAPPSASAPAGSSAAEATPAGGTQAGPQG
jgi:cell division protein FtsL